MIPENPDPPFCHDDPVNDPSAAEDIAAWIASGGPGLADLPHILGLYAFTPPRRVRDRSVRS